MSSAQVYEIAFRLGASVNSNLRSSFNNATNQLSNLETRSGMTNKAFKTLAAGAVATAAAIGGLTLGIGAAIKANDEFRTSMKQIQASTGTSLAGMKEIQETAKNLYNKNLGEDWNDLAESISTAKSVTGLTGKALEQATANAIAYRDVWGEEVSQSIKATDTMMRNFGITSDQAYNLMAQGAQKGLNKSDELIDSANEYAPYFAKIGFDANQMFDVFSAGLKNGAFNLDKVGDAVKEFGIRSKDGSKTSMEAYQMIGMSGEKMTQIFAKGGPAAQKAFNQVVAAIKNVKDPAVQNAAAVGLFGTQAEDLEMKVITSMGNVRSQFDMTRQTMEQVRNIKYDTLGMAIQGIGRQIETGFLIPLGDKLLPTVTKISKGIGYSIPTIQKIFKVAASSVSQFLSSVLSGADKVTSFIPIKEIKNAFKYVTGGFDETKQQMAKFGDSIEGTLGPKTMKIVSIFNRVKLAAGFIKEGLMDAYKQATPILSSIGGIFQSAFSIIAPILSKIGAFALNIFGQISSFWKENGPQIIQAVQNLFSGINKVIQFLAPVITFILETVWGNVQGVIQGAISVILGLIKVFAGVFTGDFSKMWEGAKQIFVGAIQFIWNAVNLLLIGKILGGIKALATGAISRVGLMWGSIKHFFSGGTRAIWTNIVNLIPKLVNGFNLIKTKLVNIVESMWQSISARYAQIVQGATSLPGKIGAGIKAMAGLALKGITSLGNTMLSGLGKVVNGVIKGINWVTSKVGIDTKINEWAVPQYARGTAGHPGGLAILGDGGGPELFRTPSGQMGLSPGKDTLMNLPKGTQVIPAKETSLLLSQLNVPAYKDGTLSNAFSTGKEWLTGGMNKLKDMALDVLSYLSEPSKLLSKVLENLGIQLPSIPGSFGSIAKGAFSMVKDKAVGFIKDKLSGFGGFTGAGGVAAPGQVQSWLMAAIQATGASLSWLGPLQTMAMKESGGNPRAINLWDSNAKRGTPSKGLLQTIDPTFNAYKMPGMNDIWNPIHNAVAAIRYIQGRYGSIFNTPGMRNMAGGGGYKGYYKGGNVPNTQWAWVGEQGPELMKIPGGSKVFDHEQSKSMITGIADYANGREASTSSKGAPEAISVSLDFRPTVNVQGGSSDPETILAALQNMYPELKSLVVQAIKEYQNQKERVSFAD
jgi:SLT domain-containing protein/phage-related minor tail protein